MAGCDDTRQLTEAQRQAAYQQQRTGVQRAVRPFTGTPSLPNLIDYINRELMPAVKQARSAVNDVYLQVADNAPSANPLGYYFSTETGAADPTTGRVRLNASPQSGSTVLRISQTNGRLVDVLPWLEVMSGSVTVPLGVVTLADAINPGRFLRADLDTMTDQGAYWDLGIVITEASHPDPFVDAEAVTLAFIPGVADNGGLGAQIPPSSLTDMSANTLLGNPTAAPAAPVEIPVAALSLVGRSSGNIEALDAPATVDGQALYMRTNAGGTLIDWFTMSEASMPRITDGYFFANMSGVSPGQVLAKNLENMAGPGLRFSKASVGDYKYVVQGSTSIIVGTDAGDDDVQRAALAGGDVTAPQNSNVLTIVADAVTNAKLANMAEALIKGRALAAGTGDPQDLTATQVKAILGTVAWTEVEETGAGPFNDYNATATDDVHLMGSNAAGVFTGVLGASQAGRRLLVTHQGSGYTQLNHNDVSSAATSRFFNGRAGLNLRLQDNEAALYIAADATSGATTAIRWILVSPLMPFAHSSVSATGDVLVFDGTSWVTLNIGTNSVLGRVAAGVVAAQVVTAQITDANVTDAKISNRTALSVFGRTANTSGVGADIAAANDAEVLRRSGTAIGFGTLATAGIADNAVTNAKLRDSGALSVIGRSANSSGDPADISATSATGAVLRESGSVLGFGTLATAGIADAAVTLAKMENRAQATVIGRASGAGTGVPQELTAAQVATIVRSAAWTEVEETGAGPFNDYNATSTTHVHLMCSNAAGVFTGVLGGTAGNMLLVSHQGTGYTELQNNNTSSTTATSRFFNGRAGKNLRIRDNEAALYIAADQTAGGGVAIRWMLISPCFPFAEASDAATGDVAAFDGTTWTAIVGGNSANVVLRGNATFGTVSAGAIASDAVTTVKILDANVTLAKMANLAAGTVIGRRIDDATGVPVALTGAEQGENIRFGTEQTSASTGTIDITLNADASRLTLTDNGNNTLRSVSGGSAVGRPLWVYNSGTGNLTVTHSTGSPPGGDNSTRIFNPHNIDVVLGPRESMMLIGQGSTGWRSHVFASPSGKLIARTVYASGSGDHVMTARTKRAVVTIVGGGGAGGGIEGAIGVGHGVGSGGGAGAYLVLDITSNLGTHAYAVGAGGTGSAGSAGDDGDDSTFHDGAGTRTAAAGSGGTLQALGTSTAIVSGVSGGARPSSTGASVRCGGQPSSYALRLALEGLPLAVGGHGAPGPWGGGGFGRSSLSAPGDGSDATGHGSGGGGAYSESTATDYAGGDGFAGIIIVEEYS